MPAVVAAAALTDGVEDGTDSVRLLFAGLLLVDLVDVAGFGAKPLAGGR
jgi:hypothetical protein